MVKLSIIALACVVGYVAAADFGHLILSGVTPLFSMIQFGEGQDDKSKCIERGGVCFSDNDAALNGSVATGVPCDKGSTCFLHTYDVSFGPYGDLKTAQFPFTDEYIAQENGILTHITIYTGDFAGFKGIITGIQLTYGTATGPLHGGKGNGNPTTCPLKPGQFFGGAFGRARRTPANFVSFIYQLGFTGTTSGVTICVAGVSNGIIPVFGIKAPPGSTYRLAYVSGTEIRGEGAMLGGLTFTFSATVG